MKKQTNPFQIQRELEKRVMNQFGHECLRVATLQFGNTKKWHSFQGDFNLDHTTTLKHDEFLSSQIFQLDNAYSKHFGSQIIIGLHALSPRSQTHLMDSKKISMAWNMICINREQA